MKNLPPINGDAYKESCAYYTELIFTKHDKVDAFMLAFPDKYKEIKSYSATDNIFNANITKTINQVERSKFMQECFNAANKHWWMKFLGKKQDIYEKVYQTALDDNESTKDRLTASKIFLAHVPDAPKEEKLTVEVKVGSDEFKNMLMEKKRLLHKAANDVIDAEIEDTNE